MISANDHDLRHTLNALPVAPNTTDSAGHSSEIGLRLRGAVSRRLFYGVSGGWLGASLADRLARTGVAASHERDGGSRASMGVGIGYAIARRTVLTVDVAAGRSNVSSSRLEDATSHPLQNASAASNFYSGHAAVQTDLTRRLFVSASFLNVWHGQNSSAELFADRFGAMSLAQDSVFPVSPSAFQLAPRFSDYGAGWRFSPSFFAQYLFTTNYGATPSSHAIMLRYTFQFPRSR